MGDLFHSPNGDFIDPIKALRAAREAGYAAGAKDAEAKYKDSDPKLLAWLMAKNPQYARQLEAERDVLNKRQAVLERQVSALRDLRQWYAGLVDGQPVIMRNSTSRFHKLEEAFGNGDVVALGNSDALLARVANPPLPRAVFLVEHDWARLLKNSEETEGEVLLPFDYCAFEVNISGLHAIACVDQADNMIPHIFYHTPHGWIFSPGIVNGEPSWRDGAALIRATCIMLDSEVAEVETIRAPEKLNAARQKASKTPLRDHHIVKLDRRRRATPAPGDGEEKTRKRLHFRRGHWRHYATFKSWVRWTLVGDPDLGFVDKEYRA